MCSKFGLALDLGCRRGHIGKYLDTVCSCWSDHRAGIQVCVSFQETVRQLVQCDLSLGMLV